MALAPDAVIEKDPNAEKVWTFDWTNELGASAIIVSKVVSLAEGVDAALTFDNDTIDVGGKMVSVRVKGGTLGERYRLTCQITTNEVPAQKDEKSAFWYITDH
jgi:hypothetical protein